MRSFKRILVYMVMATLATAFLSSCDKNRDRDPEEYNKVLILFSNGFNSLSEYLREDLTDFSSGYIPSRKSGDVILIISKITTGSSEYATKTSPVLLRLTKGKGGEAALEPLMVMPEGSILADKDNIHTLLTEAKNRFPAESYGMVVSSHATGWLPSYYFSEPSKFDNSGGSVWLRRGERVAMDKRHLYVEPERDPSLPDVKSITQEIEVIDGKRYSHEVDIKDFADAIPMHMDYILFDACLMGGIEVAYQMKDVTDRIGFSQTEVLADGYDYANLASRLLVENNPQSVCEDYFRNYDEKTGQSRSATISYVDCTKLDDMASVCAYLFEKYRNEIATVNPYKVQAYFYNRSCHWHYDLYDIVDKAGVSKDDLERLQKALDKCVLYNAATPSFFSLKIDTHCGFSMYLPVDGSDYLDDYYTSLAWNEATSLVR